MPRAPILSLEGGGSLGVPPALALAPLLLAYPIRISYKVEYALVRGALTSHWDVGSCFMLYKVRTSLPLLGSQRWGWLAVTPSAGGYCRARENLRPAAATLTG